MDNVQQKIVEKNERNVFSRALHAKSDKDAIATWKQEFNRILQIFNVDVKGICRDLSVLKESALNQHHLVSATRLTNQMLQRLPSLTRLIERSV